MRYKVKVIERHVGFVIVEADTQQEAEQEALFSDVDTEFEIVLETHAVAIERD